MTDNAWQAYDKDSVRFFDMYESLAFSDLHRGFLQFLPDSGVCLDVGAGSGRDAAALAKKGYKVVAVEPSDGLRTLAEKRHTCDRITWVSDTLPLLSKVRELGYRYRFILLSAVWMHLQPNERLRSLQTLSKLLEHEGHIALTLRLGPGSVDRVMYSVSSEELLAHARQVDLCPVYVSPKMRDSLNRGNVEWQKVVLAHS